MTGLPPVTDRDAADDRGWFAANPGRRYRIRETVGAWWVIRQRGEEVLLRAILLSPLDPCPDRDDTIKTHWWATAWPQLTP
jgi:hypothetical protein